MYYMNKTKRGLIIAAAILNIFACIGSLVLTILALNGISITDETLASFIYLLSSIYPNLVYAILFAVVGVIGSVLLLYSVRAKGKYYRSSQGKFAGGLVIVIIFGDIFSWALLFISLFVADIVVMNSRSDVRREERFERREEKQDDEAYEAKKRNIENLKKLRDDGIISEEEYKKRLFELL